MWTLNPTEMSEYNRLRLQVAERLRLFGQQVPEPLLHAPATHEGLQKQMGLLRDEVARLEQITALSLSDTQKDLMAQMRDWLHKLTRDGIGSALRRLWMSGSFVTVPDSVDRYGYDPAFEKSLEPFLHFLYHDYWRIECEGINRIPTTGGAMLVANHAGLLPFDSLMIRYAVVHNHSTSRAPRFLIEDWFYQRAMLSIIMNRIGFVRGCQENARSLLQDGELIGIFPEGVQGISKLYRQRYRVRRFGRGGSIRLAASMATPVIPVAVVGSEETYPILAQSAFLARVLRVPFFPLTPQFPLLGPFGLLPLPSAWSLSFGEPYRIMLPDESAAEYDIQVHHENERLRDRVQAETARLYSIRRSAFWH